jgi:hypothetical protein
MSLEHELPVVSQPTLPPPAARPPAPQQRRNRLIAGGAVAAVAIAIGAYALVAGSHHPPVVTQASAVHPPDLTARIDRAFEQLPSLPVDQPCTGAPVKVPLALYTPPEARARNAALGPVEADLFAQVVPLHEIEARLGGVPRVAVLRTVATEEPQASLGSPAPGRYEGQLVVIDASTGAPLCHTRVIAWSSASVVEPGVSEHALRDDFSDRVEVGISEAAARLDVEINL